ncbi:exopolyphosphatase/guanosine-5'-triphosphate,3'-diphosphate pyrophosphatase [Alicyclobacillus sacchari]|uniref:Exopolyphosphatase/guanosine-5'-triphosphate, 3'-diphosphate pyrophosphatase n=1 Tax=Alicyclobacillus sacchari TaxID=392010 RepID=A0A4R8LNW3_9BACL|nr:Ppx/GppA phosphatase family protein [Alicyclobacillus sacchari]TDY47972.1 exopolyphosphatase/guanosine-5'-triphosphate,3'-diphosphate pyrophosphatase [Alicyclobacillus sacchari]GMA56092.1 exopolyphosphatase [Alicyclobacillus sacchari]
MERNERLGILDLGSNSCRMSLFDTFQDSTYRPVYEVKQNVRLAEGLAEHGGLTNASLLRAMYCLKRFVHIGQLYGVNRWIAVATAAVRQANNREDVLSLLERETGVTFRVLTGDEEARYGYLGVINTVALNHALVFDIGGASSELCLVLNRQLLNAISIPFGALNLREMYGTLGEEKAVERAYATVAQALSDVPWLAQAYSLPLIGLGGTARAIAKLHMGDAGTEWTRLHGYSFPAAYTASKLRELQGMSVSKRRKIKGIAKHRAEIITSGMAVLQAIIDQVHPAIVYISRNGIREGLLFDALLGQTGTPVVSSVLAYSVSNFQRQFEVDRNVAAIVTTAALRLFDAMQSDSDLGQEDRIILWTAAQIEGAGTYVHPENAANHAAYLVQSTYLYGLSNEQWARVGHVVSGKTGDPRCSKLSVLLRLARWLTLELGVPLTDIGWITQRRELTIAGGADLQAIVPDTADGKVVEDAQRLLGITLHFSETTP